MSNRLSKVCSTVIPGELYQTAIDDRSLAIDSRLGDRVHFTVFDLESGDMKKQFSPDSIDPWHSLVAVEGDLLFLQYFENKKNPDLVSHLSLNWRTGEAREGIMLPETESINSPVWLSEGSESFDTIKQFLEKDAVLGCEYLEKDDLVIFSYYLGKDASYDRFILALGDGAELFHIELDNELKGFAPGSFFTTENRLIFARHKNEINIYEI